MNEKGRFLFVLVTFFAFSLGALFLTYRLSLGPVRTNGETVLLMIKLFSWAGGILLGYALFRLALRRAKAADPFGREQEGVGGRLVNTFHGIIHQLKQKEIALTQMHEYILQSVTSGIVTFSPEGLVTTANPAAEAILGFEPKTMLGVNYEIVFGTQSPVPRFIKETLGQRRDAVREECQMVQKNGEKKFLGFTTSTLRDPSGKTIGAIIVFIDLTEMKRLQEQVDLKKRLEMMGEISAWVAHEFRNYMGTIVGYASLLSKEFASETPQQEMTRAISRECATMESLITDLLAYGKKPVLTLQRIDITMLIKEILGPFKAAATGVSFDVEMASCDIAADGTLMRQALFNLVQNAMEAMGRKGTLTLRLVRKTDGSIEIKLSDSGRGIPAREINLIFLPFFTTREQGSGLGLALVHKIILSHNGVISVESKEGKGTTFTMTLPAYY